MTVTLHDGNCLDIIPQLVAGGLRVDAIVTDPPYHLTSGNASFDWDSLGPETHPGGGRRAKTKTEGRGHKTGFLGQQWDGGDIAFRPETWATIGAALKPGGYLVAFGGTRTHHRIWCAIEDAGFVIQDTIMWLYGQGFPKGRTQLKPAFEPICVAYKPGGKRELGIDECRVGVVGGTMRSHQVAYPRTFDNHEDRSQCWARTGHDRIDINSGRWPANIIHDGSDEVVTVFAVFGERKSMAGDRKRPNHAAGNGWGIEYRGNEYTDNGTAARFFYSAKADKEDRWGSKHPTVKPIDLISWLVKLVTPPSGMFLDPFAGSGTSGVAALATGRNALLIERDPGYCVDIRARMAHYEGEGRHSVASKARDKVKPADTLPLFSTLPLAADD